MRRSLFALGITSLVIAVASLVMAPRVSAGGGGCHEPQSDAHGTSVDLKQFCMLPTVIRVDEGATVTWTNRDEAPHTVTGAAVRSDPAGAGAWGSFEQLAQGQTFTHTFADAGVFPYYCMIHPGMIGAVVVGDGVAKDPYPPGGVANTTANGSEPRTQTQTQAQQRSAPTRSSTIDGTFVAVLAAFGIAIGAGAAVTLYRLRRHERALLTHDR